MQYNFGTGQRVVMLWGWEGDHRFGNALAMCHGLSGRSTYWLKDLWEGDKYPAYDLILVWHPVPLQSQSADVNKQRHQHQTVTCSAEADNLVPHLGITQSLCFSTVLRTVKMITYDRRHYITITGHKANNNKWTSLTDGHHSTEFMK